MEKEEIFKKLKEILIDILDIKEDKITYEATFLDDFGADSLDIVEIVMAMEEAFNIEIPDEDVEKISSVKDAAEYIQSVI
ncbi:MAG: acyl carrier protein [Actinomycetia bacterium]|nr:acyl carrier protein [Actinomycetes bacterium]